ncbi:MAG: hypothetical protein R2682_01530 [Pyrinomonadaceae bacterium]
MKSERNFLKERMLQVTQRLDHSVPDPEVSMARNQEAAIRLASISERLATLLPDPSLSPDERLERLARVVQDRIPQREHLQPAVAKVAKLTNRLDELVPGDMSAEEKIAVLANRASELCNDESKSCVEALELLGDKRAGLPPVK